MKYLLLVICCFLFVNFGVSQTKISKRITTKEETEGNHVERIEETYNEKGQIQLYYSSYGQFYTKEEYTYDEKGLKIKLSGEYNDEEGGEYTSVIDYTYDEKGRLLSEINTTDYDEQLSPNIEYFYSGSGNKPDKAIYKNIENGEEWVASEYYFSYNNADSIIEVISANYLDTKKNNYYREKKQNIFNEKNIKTESLFYDESDNVKERHTFEYNKDGKLSKELHYNSSNEVTITYNYTYDEKKNLITIEGSYDNFVSQKEYYYYDNGFLQGENEIENGVVTLKILYEYEFY